MCKTYVVCTYMLFKHDATRPTTLRCGYRIHGAVICPGGLLFIFFGPGFLTPVASFFFEQSVDYLLSLF